MQTTNNPMSIITITSDFGYKDFYVSALKAEILSINPAQKIVDISHEVKLFNVKEGSYILKSVYKKFPKGSIHLFLVNEGGLKNDDDIYAFMLNDHYIICTGIALINLFEDKPQLVVKVKNSEDESFRALNNHVNVACKLASGQDLSELGEPIELVKSSFSTGLMASQDSIIGAIMHIDSYGNAITNIGKTDFENARKGRKYEISFGRERVTSISKTYKSVELGDPICLFNDDQKLELALSFGPAARLMGLKVEHKVKISFS